MSPSPAEVEAYLHRHIPLSRTMEVRVRESDLHRVVLEAPLEPNLNHADTAFGGSVAAVAILAGWARVHLRLRSEGLAVQTVIQRTAVEYTAPIHAAFTAVCEGGDARGWSKLLRGLQRHGRGRIHLSVRVESEGRAVAACRGSYVALSR